MKEWKVKNKLVYISPSVFVRAALFLMSITIVLCFLNGCGSTPLPKMGDLPSIPHYGDNPLQCMQGGQCAVSTVPGYQSDIKYISKNRKSTPGGCCTVPILLSYDGIVGTPEQIQPDEMLLTISIPENDLILWTKEGLGQMNLTVHSFSDGYLTREKRLTLDRLVIPSLERINYLKYDGGAFYDVLMRFSIFDPVENVKLGDATAWGRSIDILKAIQNAAKNVTAVEDYHRLLCKMETQEMDTQAVDSDASEETNPSEENSESTPDS